MKRLMKWLECQMLMVMARLTSRSSTKWHLVNPQHLLVLLYHHLETWKLHRDLERAFRVKITAWINRRLVKNKGQKNCQLKTLKAPLRKMTLQKKTIKKAKMMITLQTKKARKKRNTRMKKNTKRSMKMSNNQMKKMTSKKRSFSSSAMERKKRIKRTVLTGQLQPLETSKGKYNPSNRRRHLLVVLRHNHIRI